MAGSPPKPWERSGAEGASGPAPFKPPSGGSTSDVVEASGTAKPGENVTAAERSAAANNANTTVSRPMPQRPWQQTGYGNTYGGAGYGSNMYSSYGGFGNTYGSGGMYGNSMYSSYGGGYGGGGMYGGGMYGGGMYGGMGGYGGYGMGGMGGYGGMGMGGPYGNQDPNAMGPPPSPPGFWMSFLRVMHGVVNFFGRISFLVEQNTQASYFFMTAMLQLFDRSGMLYGELARFVLRLLGVKRKPKKGSLQGPEAQAIQGPSHQFPEAPKAGNWDSVWGN